jgi:putative thioredoxin
MPGPLVIDVGDDDFEREVVEFSKRLPVVLDLWAPWCGPCRVLGPALERLAQQHAGAFRLAKLDVDRAPRTAQALAVRSIPTVLGLRDGEVVAEFVGAQPEPVLRQFLARLLPSEADQLGEEGARLAEAGHLNAAEERFRAALEREANHAAALLGLARLHAERGETEQGLALLERVSPASPLAPEAERLAAALRVRGEGAADVMALRSRLASEPADLAARLALGRALAAAGRHEEALGELLECVRRDRNFEDGAARKAMLDVFAVLGPEHPLTARFRSELARVLFR